MENNIESALVLRGRGGDQSALKMLYMHYATDMFNICLRITGNRQDAEDVVQESFISAFKNLNQLKHEKIFGGWLRQIVIHKCLRLTKKRISLEELNDHYEATEEADSKILEKSEYVEVNHAIKNLPEGCRQIFLLYTSEDYTHKQIGELLQISESTSKSQYLRAKRLLLQQLKQVQWTK